jgi:putative addiction module killer protein
MVEVRATAEFGEWLSGLRDHIARGRLARRLDRVRRGNLGDVASVGDGVMEMREHFGPGWRMYYVQRGDALIMMLGGGDKSSQDSDIAAAKRRAVDLDDRS